MTILNPSFWNALVTLPLTSGAICVIAISPFCAADAVPAVVALVAVVVAVPVAAAVPVGATVFITVVFTVVTRVSILEPFLYAFVTFVAVSVSVVVTFFLDDFTFFFFF